MGKEKFISAFYKVKNSVSKHSPEILIGVGIVGIVVSAVWACKETIEVNDILKSASDELKSVKNEVSDEKEIKRKKAKIYIRTSGKVLKRYSGPILVGGASVASIIVSNSISRKRLGAMAAAYATVDGSFKAYRKNVVERFGEEVDNQLRYNIKQVEIKEKEKDENGKEKTVKKKINVTEQEEYSDYARFFDESNPYWQKDADLNYMFLRAQQSYFNDKLRVEKQVFLNDVYKALGYPVTKAGQIVGWEYDPTRTDIDNYIDFGIQDIHKARVRDFVNGYERTIILDFNVDGNIWKNM